jgi:hypothetical protein
MTAGDARHELSEIPYISWKITREKKLLHGRLEIGRSEIGP